MNWSKLSFSRSARAIPMVVLGAALVAALAVHAQAQSAGSPVGTWVLTVTLTDCATGAPQGPSFPSLVTYHSDGTTYETPGSTGFAAGQRAPGHGKWSALGANSYRQQIVALVLFDTPANLPGTPGFNPNLPVSPGFFAGGQVVTQASRIVGNALTSSGTVAFYRLTGGSYVPYRTGCSSATGWRFE